MIYCSSHKFISMQYKSTPGSDLMIFKMPKDKMHLPSTDFSCNFCFICFLPTRHSRGAQAFLHIKIYIHVQPGIP